MKLVRKYSFRVMNVSQFYPRPGTAAAKMQKVNSKQVKARSREISKFYKTIDRWSHLLGREQLVLITESETNSGISQLVAHNKSYVKVIIISEDLELLGKMVLVKFVKVYTWHIEGEIVDKTPDLPQASPDYFEGVSTKISYEKRMEINQKIRTKI